MGKHKTGERAAPCVNIVAQHKGKPNGHYKELITFVNDRAGHDRRYAINCYKIKQELGWTQSVTFETGLDRTIEWYLNNQQWVEGIVSGEYREWIEKNYGQAG